MDHDNTTHDPSAILVAKRQPADIVFAIFALAVAVLLLSQLAEQTKFVKGANILNQPGFWPALSLSGMTLFGLFNVFFSWRAARRSATGAQIAGEVLFWLRTLEFAIWFMAYVFLAPITGYLPATLIFCLLLALRLGYRNKRMLGFAILTGIGVVLLFKTFLQVKIPGGSLYEFFPGAFRNILITYF